MKLDKYDLYTRAVQDPPAHCDFLFNVYRDLFRREPKHLREDFCGTFALAHEWVTRDPKNTAVAVDKASAPLTYGRRHYLDSLAKSDRSRLRVFRKDVCSKGIPGAEIFCALNFSYGVFKQRRELRAYLQNVHRKLAIKGMVVLDVLGGVEMTNLNEIRADYPDFTYFWEQIEFNPLTREALFQIHFQLGNGRKRKNVFTYDWRMWTVPELREILEDVGFRRTHVFWEGSSDGPDVFEPGASWVAYVVGQK